MAAGDRKPVEPLKEKLQYTVIGGGQGIIVAGTGATRLANQLNSWQEQRCGQPCASQAAEDEVGDRPEDWTGCSEPRGPPDKNGN